MAELPALDFLPSKRADQCTVSGCEEAGDAWEFGFTVPVPVGQLEDAHIQEVSLTAKFCEGHREIFHPALALRVENWSFSIAIPPKEPNGTE